MAKNKNLVDLPKDHGLPEQIPIGFSPDCKTKIYSVGELISQMEDGRLKLPDFQRKYIWSNKVKQAFLRSLFMNLPIIGITFTLDLVGSARYIVDGFQRLSTIKDFVNNQLSMGPGAELHNAMFADLPLDKQREFKYKEVTINEIKIERKFWPFLFRNINRGGIVLNDHELRRAMPWGENYEQHAAIIMLDDFSDLHQQWLALFGKNSRYKGFGQIIRSVAMYNCYKTYQKPLSQFLDSFCAQLDTFIPDPDKLQTNLNLILESLYNSLGKNSFRLNSGKPVNAGVVDLMIYSGLKFVDNNPNMGEKELSQKLIKVKGLLLKDQTVIDSLTIDTSGRVSMVSRLEKADGYIASVSLK